MYICHVLSKNNVRYISHVNRRSKTDCTFYTHINQTRVSLLTVSFTPPPSLFLCRNIFISNPLTKNAIVSSYCVLSVTSIVILCNIAFVSLNSGSDPTAAFAVVEVVSIDEDDDDDAVAIVASSDC